MTMDETALQKLLDEVKSEFDKAVKAEESKLAKSEDATVEAKKEASAPAASAPASETTPPAQELGKKEKEEKAEKKEDEDEDDDKDDKKKDKKKDKKDDDKDDEKESKKSEGDIYEKMTKAERAEAYKVLKRHIWADQGVELTKSEKEEVKEEPKAEEIKVENFAKAEEVKALSEEIKKKDSEIEEMKKSISEITKALGFWINGPDRKSVASVAELVKKPGEGATKDLSRQEIRAKAGAMNPATLSKSERETVNTYFISGGNEEEVKKLLEKK